MDEWFSQAGHGVRFEWGPAGARRLAPHAACLVVIDVLSFTTSVTVAVVRGTRVFPCRWGDEAASVFAAEVGASLAVGRRSVTAACPWSLSPAVLRSAPFTPRLVLPSPNGSAIAAAAARSEVPVVAGSLRNAAAVGEWLAVHGHGTGERPVGVIAAGERRPDGSLRPALEDLLGAGAVIASLRERTGGALSPEAAATSAAFTAAGDVGAAVAACSSGRELTGGGFAYDVAVATEFNACALVPLLDGGAFTHAA